jgi:hypothetical protein
MLNAKRRSAMRRHIRFWPLLFLLVAATLTGCERVPSINPVENPDCAIQDYGENVYFFSCIMGEFGSALARARRDHPELDLVSVTWSPGDSRTAGYFVTFKAKPMEDG